MFKIEENVFNFIFSFLYRVLYKKGRSKSQSYQEPSWSFYEACNSRVKKITVDIITYLGA